MAELVNSRPFIQIENVRVCMWYPLGGIGNSASQQAPNYVKGS